MTGYKGRSVVITGGAGGIGMATARAFLVRNAKVHLVDIDDNRLGKAASELGDAGAVTTFASLLDSPAACAAALDAVGAPVYALVHLAGVFEPDPMTPETRSIYERAMANNLTNAYDMAVAFTTRCDTTDGPARIVLTSSLAFRRGSLDHVAYSAAKGGIVGLTRGLARQLAPNVLVNAIAPGVIRTPMIQEFVGTATGEQRLSEILLRRYGEPSEVAGVIEFLCSTASTFITGQTLNVDGGANMA